MGFNRRPYVALYATRAILSIGMIRVSGSRPTVIVSDRTNQATKQLCDRLGGQIEVVSPGSPGAEQASGILLSGNPQNRSADLQLCMAGFLETLPDGLVLIDSTNRIVWHNSTFQALVGSSESLVDRLFLESLGEPELIGPESVQLHTGPGEVVKAIYKTDEKRFVAIRTANSGIPGESADSAHLTSIVVRDVSEEILENNKREAIYRAGIELGDLSPDEVTEMSHEDRADLLKEKILEYSQDILGFDTIEIRVLNPATNELIPLLEEGMQEEAATRKLFALASGNGVTGAVAATGESYLCKDTTTDALYISGAADARSSLTVPLVMHEEVLGTFNVEGPTASFDLKDLEFLEVFGCVVAMAVNQLQLLVAEKLCTVTESSNRLRRDVALPTDDILSTATAILEKYIGHDPDVCERLQKIVDYTRTIRGHIDKVSEHADAADSTFESTASRPREQRPALKGKRILVVDSDDTVLKSAHELLDKQNCTVEAVRSGEEACQMARSHHYDVVLADIRLPDMNGFDCFCQIQDIDDRLPIILMTGFGYDAGHVIVKSRQRGLKAVLYKPFRREQLLTEVEKAVTPPAPHE